MALLFVVMEDSPWTLPAILARQAELRPRHVALRERKQAVTYAELARESDRIGVRLRAMGLKPGTRVAILDHDSARLFAIVFGIAKAGCVIVGMNWRLGPGEIAFQLQDAEVELLFVGSRFVATGCAAREGCERLATLVQIDDAAITAAGVASFADWMAASPAVEVGSDPVVIDREDIAVQMYTSGTTGKPKGVMLAHRSFVAIIESMRSVGDPWIGWSENDVSLMAIPSFHIGGMWWAMTGFNAGATNVVVPAFSGWFALEAIAAHRVTRACMVPAMIQLCLSEPDVERTDFSSLQTIVYGGSPIPRPNLELAMRTFGCGFAQIYGLTETGNTAVCLRPADHERDELLEAAGKPYPGVHIKIIDDSGESLPVGMVGEVCIKSPANMLGYWRRPEATEATLQDGYVHTGDAGFLDAEGYVHVCDRVKDMICSAGENLYPAEIESVLCGHAAVLEAAVIGIPDERWGEQAIALVVLRDGAEAKPSEIIDHVRGQLADFKVPRRIDFLDALPRTPSGKIQKHILREPYWEGRSRRVN